MFQLRFLIASPRKMSPHIFCHRDYRGQRTKPEDFHPSWNTYICQPKGTQTSYDVMLELMQSAAANQSAQQLFSLVELFNPQTNERLKLKGDEIILRPSDLAAAQKAFYATVPASTESVNEVISVNPVTPNALEISPEEQIAQGAEDAKDIISTETPQSPASPSPSLTVLDRVRAEILTNGKATAVQIANTLGISAQAIKDAVASEGSGLQNKGGWISLV